MYRLILALALLLLAGPAWAQPGLGGGAGSPGLRVFATGGGGIDVASGAGTTNVLMKFDASDNAADSVWTDDGTLLTSTTALGLGLGTATPMTISGTAFTTPDRIAHVLSATGRAFVAVTGVTNPGILITDDNAAANAKTIALISDAGSAYLQRYADGLGTAVAYLSANLATDIPTFGSASVAGVNYVSGTGNHTFSDGEMLNSQAAITAGSGTGVTVNAASAIRTVVYKVTVLSTNCIAAALTCDLTIATLPAKTFLRRVWADLTTTYACTAVCTSTTLSATLGTTAGGTELLASWDLDAAAIVVGDADGELGSSMTAAARTANGALLDGVLGSWTGTTTLTYRITSGTGNLGNGAATNLSQGTVTFYLTTDVHP